MTLKDITTYDLPVIDDIESIWEFGDMIGSIGDWVLGLGNTDTNVSKYDIELLQDMQSQLTDMSDSLTTVLAGQNLTEEQVKALSELVGQNKTALETVNSKMDSLQKAISSGFNQIIVALGQIQGQNAATEEMLSSVFDSLEILSSKINVLQATLGYGISYNATVAPTQQLKYTNDKLKNIANVGKESDDKDVIDKFLLLQDFAKEVSDPGPNGLEASLNALYNACVGNEILTSNIIDSSCELLSKTSARPDLDVYRVTISLLNIFVAGYGTLATCQMLVNRPVVSSATSKDRVNRIIDKLIDTIRNYTSNFDLESTFDDSEELGHGEDNLEIFAPDGEIITGLIIDDSGVTIKHAKMLKNYENDKNPWDEDTIDLTFRKMVCDPLKSMAKRNSKGVTELLKGIKQVDNGVEVHWIEYDPSSGKLGETRVDFSAERYTVEAPSGLLSTGALYPMTTINGTDIFSGIEVTWNGGPIIKGYSPSEYKSDILEALEDKSDFAKFGKL